MIELNDLKYEKGLIQAIAQDAETKDVLMCAYMNKEALQKTIETGYAHYWSRSRQKLWKKGESSNHLQKYWKCVLIAWMPSLCLSNKKESMPHWIQIMLLSYYRRRSSRG